MNTFTSARVFTLALVFYMTIQSINLRFINSHDWDLLLRIEHSPDSRNYTTLPVPSELELKDYLHSTHDFFIHGQIRYVIESNGVGLGFLDFSDSSIDFRCASIGIYVLPEYRKRHVALDAIGLSLSLAKKYGIEKLLAFVESLNMASINLFLKAGFRYSESIDAYQVYSYNLNEDI
jgi:RimJ/RimL family protein N-acetyltransferase